MLRQWPLVALLFALHSSAGASPPARPCAPLFKDTALGYRYAFDFLSRQAPVVIADISGRRLQLQLQLRLVTHDCTEAGRAAAMASLLNGTQPDPATGAPGEPPVHLVLGGNGINALGDALQADAAARVLLHCCTARDSVYQLNLPHVYGLFTPASRYTGTVLRTMALRGVSRVAVVYTTDSLLHKQLCEGAIEQLPLLAELRHGIGSVVVLNYTNAQAAEPGFWDATSALVAGSGADALVMCDEIGSSAALVKRLRARSHGLTAMWLAGYGNVSDFTANLNGGSEYALTTVQWVPSLPYADATFGSAKNYADAYELATQREATYFSAAASASVYVVLTALQQLVSLCSLDGLATMDADAVLWQEAGLACSMTWSRSQQRQRVDGQSMLMHVLDVLNVETFFGPVNFNAIRQNIYHPSTVVQVIGGKFAVVLPLDVADAALVMPIPPEDDPRGRRWVKTTAGTAVTVVLCSLGALCLGLLAAVYRRRVHAPRLSVAAAVEILVSDITVDISPTRNMDGTWEPGEGIYRGTRCKLVVATELLPPAPEKALPVARPAAPVGPILEDKNCNFHGNFKPFRAYSCDALGPAARAGLPEFTASQNSTIQQGRQAGVDGLTDVSGNINALTTPELEAPAQLSLPLQPPTSSRGYARKTSDGFAQGGMATPRGLHASFISFTGLYSPVPAQKADAGFPKRSRRQIAATVWRAVRLQHPRICPVLGIVWEWPDLLEGGASVPVLVRQASNLRVERWYEFDNLSRLLENETVPLPLRTKGSIAQGIAEGLAYLHAQKPPIVASIEASRVIMDRNFTPHLFLRLCNLDPDFASRPAKLRVSSAASWAGQYAAAGAAGHPANSPGSLRVGPLSPAKLQCPPPNPHHTSVMIDTCPELVPGLAGLVGGSFLPAADSPCLMSPSSCPSVERDVYEFGALLCQIFLGSGARDSSSGSRLPRIPMLRADGNGEGADGPPSPGAHADAHLLTLPNPTGHGVVQLDLRPVSPLTPPPDEVDEQEAALCALSEICPELGALARICTLPNPSDRPSLAFVVKDLELRVLPALSGNGGGGSHPQHGTRVRRSSIISELVLCPRTGAPRDPKRVSGNFTQAVGSCGARSNRLSNSFTRQDHRPRRHVLAPDDLLFDLFPPKLPASQLLSVSARVARALQAGEPVQPERYECVSIFFSDVVGYTDLCAQLQPGEVMDLVHRIYSQFDALIQAMQLFKVETVGDAYLAVSNLRWPQPASHARLLAQFALSAVRAANQLLVLPDRPDLGHVHVRVGLHCGPVVASVVGMVNRRYCLFGDAVNCAARMEHNSEVDRVHCSGAFAALVREQWPEARLVRRGVIPIKGKG
ncbi:Atrial natriuretic peptide receptor 1 [Tetrabaena socialis]|uniref:Atrial natriuretic peptide receptor 1 n=1 Tax=Tetrabaena socialis TaxID=47790 RepID=A0A2J8AF25_9CHLO|nr:Atrial natriuretic peptide receptor 1 [Tetrabaena socialis]|eukprot:PNH11109.1 Atrial natriuretic peptide receptor 1 [Tetrabaena socialis]